MAALSTILMKFFVPKLQLRFHASLGIEKDMTLKKQVLHQKYLWESYLSTFIPINNYVATLEHEAATTCISLLSGGYIILPFICSHKAQCMNNRYCPTFLNPYSKIDFPNPALSNSFKFKEDYAYSFADVFDVCKEINNNEP